MKQPIEIGIIGTGFARATQIPAFRSCAGARIAAVASGRRENAERVAAEYDIPIATDDWREIVARDEIDLIVISTPPVLHLEMALAALDVGKGVLCEKPMAMDAHETATMSTRARECRLLAHIDHELRFIPARRTMRRMIADGAIGVVRHASLVSRRDSHASSDRTWDWWSDAESGGGELRALGSHAVDALQWLLGAEVTSICGSLSTHVRTLPDPTTGAMRSVTTDDEAAMLVRFARTALTEETTGTISTSAVQPGPPGQSVHLFGSTGALMTDQTSRLWHAPVGTGEWRPVEVDIPTAPAGARDTEWTRGFGVFARRLVEALSEGASHVEEAATFDDGHCVQRVLDAARRSHAERRWIDIEA